MSDVERWVALLTGAPLSGAAVGCGCSTPASAVPGFRGPGRPTLGVQATSGPLHGWLGVAGRGWTWLVSVLVCKQRATTETIQCVLLECCH
jgi:hypothetical protein